MTEVETTTDTQPQATENTFSEGSNELSSAEWTEDVLKERQTGRVKWFNNRAGYRFVTLTRGKAKGRDVFVDHSGVQVDKEQYKYLVQGEYVEFNTCKSSNEKHPYQACDIRGIDGEMLMCETRFENRQPRGRGGQGGSQQYNRQGEQNSRRRNENREEGWSMAGKGGNKN